MIRVSLCQRNKSKKIFTWYARIFDTETKLVRYESLGTTKKTEAHDLMHAKHANGDYSRNQRSSMTLGRAFDLYIADCESRGCNAASVATMRRFLSNMKELYGKPVAEITKAEVLETFNRNAAKYKASSYNAAKTAIRTAFRFSMNVLEAIETNPAECLKSRKSPSRERDFWTVEQIDKILDKTEDWRYRLSFAFMAFAGLRIHEAIKVKPSDICGGFLSVVGKGGKFAKIPISSRMAKELERAEKEFDLSGLKRVTLYSQLGKIAKEALGDSFSGSANPHRFRHSFASNLIRAGVNVKSVQKLMRHSNIQTTLNIYSHLMEDDLSLDIEKMFNRP